MHRLAGPFDQEGQLAKPLGVAEAVSASAERDDPSAGFPGEARRTRVGFGGGFGKESACGPFELLHAEALGGFGGTACKLGRLLGHRLRWRAFEPLREFEFALGEERPGAETALDLHGPSAHFDRCW